jgi:hypothetical protein
MKTRLCGLICISLLSLAFPADNRKGFVLGLGILPDFSYSVISTSLENNQNWYSQYLGGCSAELRFGYSVSGTNVSSFVSSFTWNYPSDLFLFSLFEGFGWSHYTRELAPCLSYDFSAGITYRNSAGIDISYPAWGAKAGFKAGYEFSNHLTFWIGYAFGGEIMNYSIQKTGIDPNDITNTIRDLGLQNVTDVILNNSIGVSLSYPVYFGKGQK